MESKQKREPLPGMILDEEDDRYCQVCGTSLAGRQAHFDERGREFCVMHRYGDVDYASGDFYD